MISRTLHMAHITQVLVGFLLLAVFSTAAFADDVRVFWASYPVNPGQVVQLTGMGLANVDSVTVTALDNQATSVDVGPVTAANVLEKSESTLSFLLPKDLDSGVFSVNLSSRAGSTHILLNAPDIYWVQGNLGLAVSPRGWLRISGRSIASNSHATLQLIATDGRKIEVEVAKPDVWSATFTIPANIPIGKYQAKVWNGSGNSSAWADAGIIAVEDQPEVGGLAMELSAAQPDTPTNDDTARINAALQAISKRGGGSLTLHYGIYRLTGALTIPDGVSLKGEATDLVTLIWRDSDAPPDSLILGVRDFAVEDLTIYAQRHFHIIKGGFDPVTGETVGRNISIRKVIIRASAFTGHLQGDEPQKRFEQMLHYRRDGVVGLLLGGSNIVVEGCDVMTSMRPIVITKATGAYVADNTFHNGRLGWYGISASDGVIFERNNIIGSDLQATGGGINTFDGPSARNVLIRNNRYETIFGWDREAMTSDGPGGYYGGAIAASVGSGVKMANSAGFGTLKDQDWRGAALFVLKGRGLGLMAHVLKRDGDTLQLDHDISTMVDQTSVIQVTPPQENYLIIGNSFTDTGAAQIFGTGYKHIFAENTTIRSYALTATSLIYKQTQPNFYIQFLNNDMSSTPMLGNSGIAVTGRQPDGGNTLLTLGIIIRGNKLNSGSSIRVDGRTSQAPAVSNVLVEQNEIDHTDVGISIGRGVENLTIRENEIRNVKIPFAQIK